MHLRWRKLVNSVMLSLSGVCAAIAVSALFVILAFLLFNGGKSVDLNFFTQLPKATGEVGGGMANAIVGSLEIVGMASLLGIPSAPVTLDLVNDVIFKGATVQGIYGRRMYQTWVQMTALLRAGRLNLEPLFGEKIGLEKFEDAFTKLQNGMAGKILMYPNGVGSEVTK